MNGNDNHRHLTMRWLLRIAVACSLAAFLLSVAAVVRVVRSASTWSPLGPYPIQNVESSERITVPLPGAAVGSGADVQASVPVVRLGQPMPVSGTKCSSETVIVHGTRRWTSVQPPGSTFVGGDGTAKRASGCAEFRFPNRIPDDVARWATDQHAAGLTPVMTLGGCETPTDDEHGEGASLCWQTEPFAILPAEG